MNSLSMKLAALLLVLLGGTASMQAGWKTPPALGEGAFHPDLLDRPLYVPLGCKAAYQAAEGWKRFTDIREKSFAGVQDVQRSDADNALYYSLEGRQGKTHGVNIRRTADGKTWKVVVK